MNAEDLARRYERRPGYDLVDYARVALPLYRITVDAVTMVHREIPPIKEFVMRSVAANVGDVQEISGFLGIDESTVSPILAQLRDDRYVSLSDDGGSAVILERGREFLSRGRESSPQNEMLVFLYDRLLRKPVRLGAEQMLAPSEVDPRRMIEIRAYPAEGPELEDLSMPDVLQVLERQAGGKVQFGRDLLKLKRIVRRARLYRPAIGLVYKKLRSSEIQVAFIVDDARDEALEHSFAERGGPKKMGFVKSIDELATTAELKKQLGSDVQKLLPDGASLEEKRIKVSISRIKYQAALVRAERRGGVDAPEAADERLLVESAKTELSEAEAHLRSFPARPILPFEIAELLDEALETTQSFLAISSRDAGGHIVDAVFLRKLEALLRRGARTIITLSDLGNVQDGPILDLERLRQRHTNLSLAASPSSSFYHLVSDSSFAVICNRPLIGNAGKTRTFHHVSGFLLQAPNLVEAFTQRLAVGTAVSGGAHGKPPSLKPNRRRQAAP